MIISKRLGHYDLLHSSDKQWCVHITLPTGAPHAHISQTWDEDDAPDIADMPPSEVAELILKKTETYLLSTGLDEQRETIEWVRANAEEPDARWAAAEVKQTEREISTLQKRAESLRETYCAAPAEG